MVYICKYCRKDKTPLSHRSFFSFPTNPIMRQKWCSNLNLDPETLKPHSKLCSDHFEVEFLINSGVRLNLAKNAYPTIKTSNQPSTPKTISDEKSDIPISHVWIDTENGVVLNDIDIKTENIDIDDPPIDVDKNVENRVGTSDTLMNDELLDTKSGILNTRRTKRPVPQTIRQNYYKNDFVSESTYQEFLKYQKYKNWQTGSFRSKVITRDKEIIRLKKIISNLQRKLEETSNSEENEITNQNGKTRETIEYIRIPESMLIKDIKVEPT